MWCLPGVEMLYNFYTINHHTFLPQINKRACYPPVVCQQAPVEVSVVFSSVVGVWDIR